MANASVAALPANEQERLRELARLNILDSLPEDVFDDIVAMASETCGTPIALISLIDDRRQWFKARVGLGATETPREYAFCAHAILQPAKVFVVENATQDARFAGNPLVTGDPNIRFYAGAPIVMPEGEALGTVCIIDDKPRELTDAQARTLAKLARQTAAMLRLRQIDAERRQHNSELSRRVSDALADDRPEHAALQQRQRIDSLGQIAGRVAHDFNNLLHHIGLKLDEAAHSREDRAKFRAAVAACEAQIERGGRLAGQLLMFSRGQAPRSEQLAPDDVILDMEDLLRQAAAPAIDLRLSLGAEGARVMGSVPQLEAAVLNLVINARDALQGRGHVTLATGVERLHGDAELEDGDYVVLEVSDDGPGMPPNIAARVFEPFFSTKEPGKGTGLGLSQVMGVALHAGGVARVVTAPGEGTTVRVLMRRTSD